MPIPRQNYIFYFLNYFTVGFVTSMVFVDLPVFLRVQNGVEWLTVGWLTLIVSLPAFTRVPLGVWLDHVESRKRYFLLGTLTMLALPLVLITTSAYSVAVLIIGFTIAISGTAISDAAVDNDFFSWMQATPSSQVEKSAHPVPIRLRWVALMMLGSAAGNIAARIAFIAIAPTVVGTVQAWARYFATAIFPTVLNLIFALLARDPPKDLPQPAEMPNSTLEGSKQTSPLRPSGAGILLIFLLLLNLPSGYMEFSMEPLLLEAFGTDQYLLYQNLLIIQVVATILVYFVVGGLATRVKSEKTATWGVLICTLLVAGYYIALAIFGTSIWSLFWIFLTGSVLAGFYKPLIATVQQVTADPKRQGAYYQGYSAAWSGGKLLGVAIMGFLLGVVLLTLGPLDALHGLFWITALLSIIAFFVFYLFMRRRIFSGGA